MYKTIINMALFNFIETIFFISLGISFVLILLLVYHFKQRLTALEQKGDTMFEIINNMVKEITNIKLKVFSMDNPYSMNTTIIKTINENIPNQYDEFRNKRVIEELEREDSVHSKEDEIGRAHV